MCSRAILATPNYNLSYMHVIIISNVGTALHPVCLQSHIFFYYDTIYELMFISKSGSVYIFHALNCRIKTELCTLSPIVSNWLTPKPNTARHKINASPMFKLCFVTIRINAKVAHVCLTLHTLLKIVAETNDLVYNYPTMMNRLQNRWCTWMFLPFDLNVTLHLN